ncbi:MAG: hypothetical protein Q4G35_04760 [Propionibacteriaceae bacterium]|nr:hypothetical protein [Propionibacteriaceae bacterium]
MLIDFQKHGNGLMDDDVRVSEARYAEELNCLGSLLDLWMLRDIRFVTTRRAGTDAKRGMTGFQDVIEGLAEAIAFQYADWGFPAPSRSDPNSVGDERGLPDGADRDLLLEAQAVGAHVFLTRDHKVLRRAAMTGPRLRIAAPSGLVEELHRSGVTMLGGGLCSEPDCPHALTTPLLPDIGKWGPLLACFQDR